MPEKQWVHNKGFWKERRDKEGRKGGREDRKKGGRRREEGKEGRNKVQDVAERC